MEQVVSMCNLLGPGAIGVACWHYRNLGTTHRISQDIFDCSLPTAFEKTQGDRMADFFERLCPGRFPPQHGRNMQAKHSTKDGASFTFLQRKYDIVKFIHHFATRNPT